MLRNKLALATMLVLMLGAVSEAAILGTATLVRDPPGGGTFSNAGANVQEGAALNGTDPASGIHNDWVAYALTLASNDGSLIGGIDVAINGILHQRWLAEEIVDENEEPTGTYNITKTPGLQITGTTNGDTHLQPHVNALQLNFDEDNHVNDSIAGYFSVAGPGGVDLNSLAALNPGSVGVAANARDWGAGSFISGAWTILEADRTTSATMAYIVIPRGSEPDITISAQIGVPLTGGGVDVVELDECDFFDCDVVEAPEIEVRGNGVVILDGDNTPSTGDHTDFGIVALGSLAQRTYTIHNTGDADLTLGDLLLTGDAAFQLIGAFPDGPIGAGGNAIFTIGLNTALEGTFNGNISFLNGDGDESPYSFDITGVVAIPEPATLMLVGLAMIGLVGYKRRHSA